MAVRKFTLNDDLLKEEDGQSLVEFFLMLPIMVGIIVVLIKVNTAIQVSIVNQQYARSQAVFLAFNSPYYPELDDVAKAQASNTGYNQMVLGISGTVVSGDGSTPEATVQSIVRSRSAERGAPDTPKAEPALRAKVRVRNTVALCTPSVFNGRQAIYEYVGNNPIRLYRNNLNEDPAQFNYCDGRDLYK